MKDLTVGSPTKVLWAFTIPMFLSVVFQQLYSIADSAIAGKFAGEDALAAIGASYPITMIFMAVAVGSNVGCAVVISQFFGAKNYPRVKTSATTTLLASTAVALLLTLFGLLFCTPLLKMVNTPGDIFSDSAVYLNIYTLGLVFLFVYNVCTGIFTSLGDSKTPLYFLIGSSVGNVALDLLFVAVFEWGVSGAAWATFIAQGVSCILSVIVILKKLKEIKTESKAPLFSWRMLGRVAAYAVPSILQQSFVSVGNIFIQGLVNSFGKSVIAGYSAAIKLNTFAVTSFSTLGNALSSFCAQCYGAGNVGRIRQGFKAGLAMALIVAVPFIGCYFLLPDTMMGLFLDKSASAAVLDTGREFLKIVAPFYAVVGIKLMADGLLRGTGRMPFFMGTTFSDLILRVILAFALSKHMGQARGIWLSWPIGWFTAMVVSLIFYTVTMKQIRREIPEGVSKTPKTS
ncbi:MAG: MATE family efflux transporter [Ruminococcus sp.]|nr:MATE family efflux transporter [Ruminococcus sp.]